MAIASQRLVSRKFLTYTNVHSNCNIVYDEMVLIFFINTFEMPHVKKIELDYNCSNKRHIKCLNFLNQFCSRSSFFAVLREMSSGFGFAKNKSKNYPH